MDEARDHGLELEAPVVPPCEAGEVSLGVIRSELSVGAGDRGLDVAERGVDPFERRDAGGLAARAGADRAMASGDPVERVPAAQPVGDHLGAGRQPASRAARDLALCEALDRGQLELARLPLGAGRDRRHEGRLAGRAAAPLAARTHPAEIGVVHLDPAVERGVRLAPRHHRHDLLLHRPGGRLLDPETAAELDRRDAVLRRHDQVDGCEPGGQRQLGRVEDRARRQRGLRLAAVALIQPPARRNAIAAMAAGRADEAVRPAQPEQGRAALLLLSERLAERRVAQPAHPGCQFQAHFVTSTVENISRTYLLTGGSSRISRIRNEFAHRVNADFLSPNILQKTTQLLSLWTELSEHLTKSGSFQDSPEALEYLKKMLPQEAEAGQRLHLAILSVYQAYLHRIHSRVKRIGLAV